MWGTVGILYNTTMVSEPVDSWGILWDTDYMNNVFMLDSIRDTMGVTLKYLGYSCLLYTSSCACWALRACS